MAFMFTDEAAILNAAAILATPKYEKILQQGMATTSDPVDEMLRIIDLMAQKKIIPTTMVPGR
jgi:hypothetical protein